MLSVFVAAFPALVCTYVGGAGVISNPPGHDGGGGSVILVPPLVKILCTFLYIALIRFSSNILSAPTNFVILYL